MKYFLLFVLLVTGQLFAQQQASQDNDNSIGTHRYLISPFQEVIPLDEKQSALMYIDAQQKAKARSAYTNCSNTINGGPIFDYFYPPYINYGATHKDVIGQWYVSPVKGVIDTVFWLTMGQVGALDSLLYLRIHKSNITPTSGPGAVPGPYNPPCQTWGYFRNTNDFDQGVAAFREDATDTTWISTYAGSPASFEPFGEEMWGNGGYPVIHHAPNLNYEPLGRVNFAVMDDLPFPEEVLVNTGDVFFISLTVNSPVYHPVNENRTDFLTGSFNSSVPGYQDFYPSRNWKFYEHDSGPGATCPGDPHPVAKKGWVARGGFIDTNPRIVAFYYLWYSIKLIDNKAPVLLTSTELRTTSSTAPRLVEVELEDCNFEDPSSAGVASASLRYFINGDTSAYNSPMTFVGGNTWQGELPGQPPNTTVSYSVVACDSQGLCIEKMISSYRVVDLNNDFFTATIDTCPKQSIKLTGTEIPSSAFFVPPTSVNTNPKDDGTAGPFDLGGTFYLFGQKMRYAWIGVNGALALSETANDTLDVNANGSYSTSWDFPGAMKNEQRDTSHSKLQPKNLIAPFWNDLYYGNTTPGNQWGHIRYEDTGCEFIVEWGGDSIGTFVQNGDQFLDKLTVRAILNKCDGSIVFQYDELGIAGLDTTATIGIQCDTIGSSAPWAFVNGYGYPKSTAPKNGTCIHLNQNVVMTVAQGWNLVSVPVKRSDYSIGSIFPTSGSSAFAYTGTYSVVNPLYFGAGFWLRFNDKQVLSVEGKQFYINTMHVSSGWNLLGSLSVPFSVDALPLTHSPVFCFSNRSYRMTDTIYPGQAYWVKFDSSLDLIIGDTTFSKTTVSSNENYEQLNSLTLVDANGGTSLLYIGEKSKLQHTLDWYEAPPMPPTGIFDARYKSGRFLEAFGDESEEFPLQIRDAKYPLIVQWNIQENKKSISLVLDGKEIRMSGTGSTKLSKEVKHLSIRTGGESILPTAFALEQNYPNPFNPSCVIRYSIPDDGTRHAVAVQLNVYNVLGQVVATLVNGEQEAGFKSVIWDASNFPSGVYMYTIHAGSFTETRKMLLLR